MAARIRAYSQICRVTDLADRLLLLPLDGRTLQALERDQVEAMIYLRVERHREDLPTETATDGATNGTLLFLESESCKEPVAPRSSSNLPDASEEARSR